MEPEFERMQRANAALEAWVRDLLSENRELRRRLTLAPERDEGHGALHPAGATHVAA
jgi:hypothetical protein